MARPGLDKNIKFRRLVRNLGEPRSHVRGYLECLWDVAYENGNAIIGDADAVIIACDYPGDAQKFMDAMLNCGGQGKSGFIEPVRGQEGRFQVHDLFDHAPRYVKLRYERETARTVRTPRAQRRTTAHSVRTVAHKSAQCAPEVELNSAGVRTPAPAPAPAPIEEPPPTPLRGEGCEAAESASVNGMAIPAELDTPAFRVAWADWAQYLREKRKTLKPMTAERQLKKLAALGPEVAVSVLENSMTNGWVGIFDPPGVKGSARAPPGMATEQDVEDAALAELNAMRNQSHDRRGT